MDSSCDSEPSTNDAHVPSQYSSSRSDISSHNHNESAYSSDAADSCENAENENGCFAPVSDSELLDPTQSGDKEAECLIVDTVAKPGSCCAGSCSFLIELCPLLGLGRLYKRLNGMLGRPEVPLSLTLLTFGGCLLSSMHSPTASKLLRRPTPPASPFMPRDSNIVDLFDGNGIEKLLYNPGLLLVMYYAPWSMESMRARWEFSLLAQHFPSNVRFVAVNCWHPRGSCRQHFRMYTYPVIALYPGFPQPVYYNGISQADYMYRFLEKAQHPYEVLYSVDDVETALVASDVSVLAHYPSNSLLKFGPGFLNFYMATLKVREEDTFGEHVQFLVIPSAVVAKRYNLTQYPQLALRTLRYPSERSFFSTAKGFKSKELLLWLGSRIALVTHEPIGSKKKSEVLDALADEITLVVVAPRRPLFAPDATLSVVRQTALKFNMCNASYSALVRSSFHVQSLKVRAAIDSLTHHWQCRSRGEPWQNGTSSLKRDFTDCCSFVLRDMHQSSKNICDSSHSYQLRMEVRQAIRTSNRPSDEIASCRTLMANRLPLMSLVDLCCVGSSSNRRKCSSVDTCGIADELDCGRYWLARKKAYRFPSLEKVPQIVADLRGQNVSSDNHLADWKEICTQNRSINFVILDSAVAAQHVRRLGADAAVLGSYAGHVTTLLIDRRREEIHQLRAYLVDRQKGVTMGLLTSFVKNGTKHQLSPRDMLHKAQEPGNVNFSATNKTGSLKVKIRKTVRSDFDEGVLGSEQDVIVFFQSPWCGLCKSSFVAFLTAAQYFANYNSLIFASIDVSQNDLPWQYTVDRLPTVIFFPKEDRASSTAFPLHVPFTVPNLIAFVLSHVSPQRRLELVMQACSKTCLEANLRNVTKRLHQMKSEEGALKRQIYAHGRAMRALSRVINDSEATAERGNEDRPNTDDGFAEMNPRAFLELSRRRALELRRELRSQRRILATVVESLRMKRLTRLKTTSNE